MESSPHIAFVSKLIMLAVAALSMAVGCSGEIRLPRLIDNNMVLQRGVPLKLWGWADPGELVRVQFRGTASSATTDETGQWTVTLPPQIAGGPDRLTFTGKNTITIDNVLVGDVWLASGQSNMAFPLKQANTAAREIDGAHFPEIRLFVVNRQSSIKPMADVSSDDGWRAATAESVSNFSAVGYLFGRELHQRYHVPVGIIESDYGGTPAEDWASATALKPIPAFHNSLESLARLDDGSRSDYERYLKQKEDWIKAHQAEDRGRAGSRNLWADPNLDASAWPTIDVPRPWFYLGKDFKGFGGTVWFRRELNLTGAQAGHGLFLHLGKMVESDTSFFNGEEIGKSDGRDIARIYFVPGRLVKSGRNVIAVRLTGDISSAKSQIIGMYGHLSTAPAKMYVDAGDQTIPLTGVWSYQTGPDLSALPTAPEYAAFASPSRDSPTILYNAMIAPLTRFAIKGVLWYQGESNEDQPTLYRTLFPALIEDWRRQWGYEFPFLFVQVAGFNHNETDVANFSWPELREAQTMGLALPNTGMATAIDLGDEEDIHPKNKQDVGHRLVLAAAKVAYGENVVDAGPTFQSMQREGMQSEGMQSEGEKLRIKFSNLGSGLLIKDKYGDVHGFEVAGADGKFVWAQARQDGDDILVFSARIPHPVSVRYDWSNMPDGNVYNQEGLPLLPFPGDAAKRSSETRAKGN